MKAEDDGIKDLLSKQYDKIKIESTPDTDHTFYDLYQNKLYEIEHPIKTIIGKIIAYIRQVFTKPSKTTPK